MIFDGLGVSFLSRINFGEVGRCRETEEAREAVEAWAEAAVWVVAGVKAWVVVWAGVREATAFVPAVAPRSPMRKGSPVSR